MFAYGSIPIMVYPFQGTIVPPPFEDQRITDALEDRITDTTDNRVTD